MTDKTKGILCNSIAQYLEASRFQRLIMIRQVEESLKKHDNALESIGMGYEADVVRAGRIFMRIFGKSQGYNANVKLLKLHWTIDNYSDMDKEETKPIKYFEIKIPDPKPQFSIRGFLRYEVILVKMQKRGEPLTEDELDRFVGKVHNLTADYIDDGMSEAEAHKKAIRNRRSVQVATKSNRYIFKTISGSHLIIPQKLFEDNNEKLDM